MSRGDYAWLAEIVKSKVCNAKPEKPPKEKPREELPTFDASKWKPTAKALELLGETRRPVPEKVAREMRIAENERKYGNGQLTHVDRLMERLAHTGGRNYARIEALAGTNGDCHSRKTTYRRMKFGSGRLTRRGWLEAGFEENRNAR